MAPLTAEPNLIEISPLLLRSELLISSEVLVGKVRLIQRWYRKTSHLKMKALLEKAAVIDAKQVNSFEESCTILKNSTVQTSTQRLLDFIQRKVIRKFGSELSTISNLTRVCLSAFLFGSHPYETLDMIREKENDLLRSALKFTSSYDSIRKLFRDYIFPKTESQHKIMEECLFKFQEDFTDYLEKFKERQVEHKSRMGTGMIDTYLKMELRKKNITKFNPSKNQREFYLLIEKSQKNLIAKIQAFSDSEALEHFYQRLEKLSIESADEVKDALCDDSMNLFYDIGLNPNFQFQYKPDSQATLRAVEEVKEATQQPPINYNYITAAFLNIRRKIIQQVPKNASFIESVRLHFNVLHLNELVPKLSSPEVFKDCFLYLVRLVALLESPAHKAETDEWVQSTLQKLQEGENPYLLVPEVLRVLHNKLDAIVVEKENFYLNANRSYWKNEVKVLAKRHFQTRVELHEIQLDKTQEWIKAVLADGHRMGLTQEMLGSEKVAPHFITMALIDEVLSPNSLQESECPEALLMERTILNDLKHGMDKIRKTMICLEVYHHFLVKEGVIGSVEGLHQELSEKIDGFSNDSILIDFLHKRLEQELQSQGIQSKDLKLFKAVLGASFSPTHRIYKTVNGRLQSSLKHFMYKGIESASFAAHPVYKCIIPSYKLLAKKLRDLAIFNLAIHQDTYEKFLKVQKWNNLFTLLSKMVPITDANCPPLLDNQIESLRNLRASALKLAHIVTCLTFIRMKVWYSHSFINTADDPESEKSHFSQQQFAELIDSYNIKSLMQSSQVSHEEISKLMKQILDDVIQQRKIIFSDEEMNHMKKILKSVAHFKNPGFIAFHTEIIEYLQSELSSIAQKNYSTVKTLKSFFTTELADLSTKLKSTIQEAIDKKGFQEVEIPFLSQFPAMRTGRKA